MTVINIILDQEEHKTLKAKKDKQGLTWKQALTKGVEK